VDEDPPARAQDAARLGEGGIELGCGQVLDDVKHRHQVGVLVGQRHHARVGEKHLGSLARCTLEADEVSQARPLQYVSNAFSRLLGYRVWVRPDTNAAHGWTLERHQGEPYIEKAARFPGGVRELNYSDHSLVKDFELH